MKQNFEIYAVTHKMTCVADFLKNLLKKNITFDKNIKILDYGCGDGGLLKYFSKFVNKKKLYGVEVSKIRVQRVKKLGFNCYHINQNKVKLKFKDNIFDVITMIEVIEHIPKENVSGILGEISRVLKPEGKFILTTPNYPTKRVYDWLMVFKRKSINKVAKDDPTHITRYNFNDLNKLLKKYFRNVKLYPSHIILENKFKLIKNLRESGVADFLGHKICGVCTK